MHRVRRAPWAVIWFSAHLLLASCDASKPADGVAPPPPETAVAIEIARPPVRIEVGDTVQFAAVVRSNRGRELLDLPITWTSSNSAIATISTTGRLTALAPGGPIVIRAAASGVTSTVEVSIDSAAVATVNIAQNAPLVVMGTRLPLTAVLRDSRGGVLTNRSITWTSADPMIVTVSDSGVLTGVRPGGPVLVTAASEGKQATASVSVLDVPTTLTRVDGFTVGATARLIGSGLTRATAVLVDTVPVTFQVEADSALRFSVPQLRRCETDGRTATITVRGTGQPTLRAGVGVVAAVLEPGQSVVIQADTLTCLQLPARDEDYVLTVLNPEIPLERTATTPWPPAIVDLLTFETGPVSLSTSPLRTAPSDGTPLGEEEARFAREMLSARVGQTTSPYADNPVPFDPRYGTATVGDTVRFPVTWRLRQQADYCSLNRSTVRSDTTLSYPVLFVVQSAFLMIGVDLRMAAANQYLTNAGRAYLQRAADAAAPYILPSARITFDASYAPMKGAGSRHFVVVTTPQLHDPNRSDWGGIAGDLITEMPQSWCAMASETHAVFVSATSWPPNGAPGFLASVILHEFGHQADFKTFQSVGTENGQPEHWASVVQEIGMRLALGRATQARYSDLGMLMPISPNILATTWGRQSAQRLYDSFAAYAQGALFNTLLREWVGETSLTPRSPTFLQQYLSLRPRWQSFEATIAAQAQALRTTPFDLLDRYVLAVTTDDLVESSAAARYNLPQLQSWDSRTYPGQPASLSRTTPVRRTLAAGPGGYDVAYLLAGGQRVGVSLEFTQVSNVPMRIRKTRLR